MKDYRKTVIADMKALRQAVKNVYRDIEEANLDYYLNERCSQEVADSYPFDKSLDEQCQAIMNWVDDILDDIDK